MTTDERVDDLDSRVRMLESSEAGMQATLLHFTKSIDNFITRLDTHEQKEDARFEKFERTITNLQKVAYVGLGALTVLQFLIANGIIFAGVK